MMLLAGKLCREEKFIVEGLERRDRGRQMDAARQGRRSNQRAAPGWDEDVDLMTGDHLADPLEITVLVIGLEPVAVDPGVCGTVIVGALMGYADEDVERGVGGPHQTSNGGKREEIGRASCRERVCQYV